MYVTNYNHKEINLIFILIIFYQKDLNKFRKGVFLNDHLKDKSLVQMIQIIEVQPKQFFRNLY